MYIKEAQEHFNMAETVKGKTRVKADLYQGVNTEI